MGDKAPGRQKGTTIERPNHSEGFFAALRMTNVELMERREKKSCKPG